MYFIDLYREFTLCGYQITYQGRLECFRTKRLESDKSGTQRHHVKMFFYKTSNVFSLKSEYQLANTNIDNFFLIFFSFSL